MDNTSRFIRYGVLGLAASLILLTVQLTAGGRGVVVLSRNSLLTFMGQIDVATSFLRTPRLWITSRVASYHAVLDSELRIRELEAKLSLLTFVKQENEDLKISLGIVNKETQWIDATLLWAGDKYFLNVGEKEGVHQGSLVLGRGSLIGVVSQTENHFSSLETIFDQGFRVGARIESGGVVGVLTRQGEIMELTTISRADDVKVGDKVISRGDPKVREAGILIGFVSAVQTRPADPVGKFGVKPAVLIDELRVVLVSKEQNAANH